MKKAMKKTLLTAAGTVSMIAGASVAANANATVNTTTNHAATTQAENAINNTESLNHISNNNYALNNQNNSNIYVVKAGDTLSQIAETHNTTVEKLVELNNISDPNFIVVGEELRLSGNVVATGTRVATPTVQNTVNAPVATQPVHPTTVAAPKVQAQPVQSAPVAASSSQATTNANNGSVAQQPVAQSMVNNDATVFASSVNNGQKNNGSSSTVMASNSYQSGSTVTAVRNNTVASAPVQSSVASVASQPAQPVSAPVNNNNNANSGIQVGADPNARQAGLNGYYNGVNGYPAGQCTSFVAGILRDSGVPSSEYSYLGNANAWGTSAASRGILVNHTATPGSVAYFGSNVDGASYYGHVAYVTNVQGNNVHLIEGNWNNAPIHDRNISMGQASGYIHFTK